MVTVIIISNIGIAEDFVYDPTCNMHMVPRSNESTVQDVEE